MAQPSLRPPLNLQPRSKAAPTFSSPAIATKSTPSTPQLSTPSSLSRQTSPARSIGTTDVSDKTTASLVRRTLCPNSHSADQKPLNELLPPLTSSNEVDLQLYAIIAIVVKDLVYSWYGKITPDQSFVEEVVRIIAHCTTQLETRLRDVDIESLILDEIPELIERHVNAYRISHRTQPPSFLSTTPHVIYHDLNPHPALSPVPQPSVPSTINEQSMNEEAYRQLLVQGALAVLLPTEDLENACLRTLVADVIAESILGNAIGGKISEDWFIWSSINRLVEVVKARVRPKATGEALKEDTRGRLEKFGLLSEKEEKKTETGRSSRASQSTFSSWFWIVLQYLYFTVVAIRFVTAGVFRARSQSLRSSSSKRPTKPSVLLPTEKTAQAESSTNSVCRPLITFKIFPLLSNLLDLPIRTPWLSGSLALLQHHLLHGPFQVGATDGILDQYVHTLLTTHLPPSLLLPPALQLLRTALFPGNTLLNSPSSSPTPPPSEEQIRQIKRNCATGLLELVPGWVAKAVFGQSDGDGGDGTAVGEVERELDVWGDAYCTKHLMYAVVELVVVRVLPEVGERGVGELVGERVGVGEGSAGEG